MRVHDRETHYELGKLRMLHDRTVNRMYRHKPADMSALELSEDPELIYNLDAIDALIEMDADQDGAA